MQIELSLTEVQRLLGERDILIFQLSREVELLQARIKELERRKRKPKAPVQA